MTKLNSKLITRTLTFLVLLTLLAGSVLEVSAQRRRTRRSRRGTRAPVTRVVTPPIEYYTVPANTVIRVRINEELNSGTARISDRFSANVVEPVYASGGVEVVPVGSKVWRPFRRVRITFGAPMAATPTKDLGSSLAAFWSANT